MIEFWGAFCAGAALLVAAAFLPQLMRALVVAWAWLLTLGLPHDVKERKQGEIESDLWEHSAEARESGYSPLQIAFQQLLRWVLGIPGDLSWRARHIVAGAMRRRSGSPPAVPYVGRVADAVSMSLLSASIGLGVVVFFGAGPDLLLAAVGIGCFFCAVSLVSWVLYHNSKFGRYGLGSRGFRDHDRPGQR